MIFFIAAIAIAVLVSILLFSKYGTTPAKYDAIENLDLPNKSRPVPKPMNKPRTTYQTKTTRTTTTVGNNVDAAASKALSDLMKQYMGPDPYGTGNMFRSSEHNLTMAEKMRLLEDFEKEKLVEPNLSEEEIEEAITQLEDELMDIEDSYASVQADAEVTGDRRELERIDERYGDLEEAIANYKDQLANYGKKQQETLDIIAKITKDLGLDDTYKDVWLDNDDKYF